MEVEGEVRNLSVAFTLPERDLIPEGIAYDTVSGDVFVGSTYRRKVVRIPAEGPPADFVTGSSAPMWGVVGMDVDPEQRLLWLASSHAGDGMPMVDMIPDEEGGSALLAFDLHSGEEVHTFVLEGDHFLNDVAVARDGTVFVTDSRTDAVYRYSSSEGFEVFVDLQEYSANGIDLSADDTLFFVAGGSDLVRVEVATGALQPLHREESASVDGLTFVPGSPSDSGHGAQPSLIVIQPWEEGRHVERLVLDEKMSRIERSEPLVAAHPALEQPTTGVLAGSRLLFIANSQLQEFSALWQAAPPLDTRSLSEPVVLALDIDGDGGPDD